MLEAQLVKQFIQRGGVSVRKRKAKDTRSGKGPVDKHQVHLTYDKILGYYRSAVERSKVPSSGTISTWGNRLYQCRQTPDLDARSRLHRDTATPLHAPAYYSLAYGFHN